MIAACWLVTISSQQAMCLYRSSTEDKGDFIPEPMYRARSALRSVSSERQGGLLASQEGVFEFRE